MDFFARMVHGDDRLRNVKDCLRFSCLGQSNELANLGIEPQAGQQSDR